MILGFNIDLLINNKLINMLIILKIYSKIIPFYLVLENYII